MIDVLIWLISDGQKKIIVGLYGVDDRGRVCAFAALAQANREEFAQK